MTSEIYQIKEIINSSDPNRDSTNNRLSNLLSEIDQNSEAYRNTKLTESENIKFVELLKILNEFESSFSKGIELELESTNKALVLLSELSTIQLEESKLIIDHAETLYFSGKASTQFAFAVGIIILLVLQSLLFTSKTLSPRNQTSAPYLN